MKQPNRIIRYAAAVFALALLMVSCTNPLDDDGQGAGTGESVVTFALSGITGGSSVVVPATRAASALADGLTVRVVAYKAVEDGIPTAANYVTNQSYVMRSGTLVPCTVDEQGSYIADVSGYTMKLTGGKYDFFCITPALPLKDKINIYPTHGIDYASAKLLNQAIVGTPTVTFGELTRQCAKVKFIVESADANMKVQVNPSGAGVTMGDKFPAGALGSIVKRLDDNWETTNGTTTLTFSPSEFTDNTAETIILPTGQQDVTLTFDLLLTTGDGTPTRSIATATLVNQTFDSGNAYIITLKVSPTGVTPTIKITDWNADINLGMRDKYPYAYARKYIVSKDEYGSSGLLLHPDWEITPSYTSESNVTHARNCLPVRLEVAAADCNSTNSITANSGSNQYLYNSAAAACAAYKQDEGGVWRVPTIKELEAIYKFRSHFSGLGTNLYQLSATLFNYANPYVLRFSDGSLRAISINSLRYLRCVRDVALPSTTYPYVKDGKYIVTKDEYGAMEGVKFHSNWKDATPVHTEVSHLNSVAAQFEVAASNALNPTNSSTPLMNWFLASGTIDTTYNPSGLAACTNGWRLPTLEELAAIYKVDAQLTNKLTGESHSHKTATQYVTSSGVSGWCIWFNNGFPLGYEKKSDGLVRCVRDVD